MPITFPAFRTPAARRDPPRSVQKLNDPTSTRDRGNTPNNARTGADNEVRSPGGLGAARPGRAGEFERSLREKRGVLNQDNFRPVL